MYRDSAFGKIYISVDEGTLDVEKLKSIAPRITGVYCVLYLGKQRAKTPSATNIASLGWSAFEFEFSIHECSNKLSVSLYAKMEGETHDQLLCSWSEETELVEEGNYERWVTLKDGAEERCNLRLYLRMEQQQPIEAVTLEDFDMLTAIGEGAFGKVMTVRKRDSGKIYAMKVLEKGRVTSKKQLARMLGERNILLKIKSPFIVGLHYAFDTKEKVYLVLDFVGGGDLFHHLRMHKKFDEECVRFWTVEIILALEALHRDDIVYRDLKPENILLEPDGHVVLVDFGLAKHIKRSSVEGLEGRSNSFVGTPEYLAPEIVQGTGHGSSVDWWTLGILMFELLLGRPPFKSKDLSILYQKIVSEDVTIPNTMSVEARSILKGLLSRNPSIRLGAHGPQQIREHAFYASSDWAKLEKKEIPPPYRPVSPTDYLSKVFNLVQEEAQQDNSGPTAEGQPEKQQDVEGSREKSPHSVASKHMSADMPDYLARVVQLIEKWQQRILSIPTDSVASPKLPPEAARHSTGSWKLTPSAAVALESPMTSQRTRVTAHGRAKSIVTMTDMLREDFDNLTPIPSPVAKGLNDPLKPMRLDMSKISMAVSPIQPLATQVDAIVDAVAPATPTTPTPATESEAGLHGLLFGHEVQQLESIIRDMQSAIESQANELASVKTKLRDALAERDVLTALPKRSGGSEDTSNALSLAMEETQSLVSLAHKMATAMSSTMGPGGEEVQDILTEAQKLMGLAREERLQVEREKTQRTNTSEVLHQARQEQDRKLKMADMAKEFAMTEEGYIQALVENQQTLATAAAEREALLQLASKLEEHSRLQANREGDLVMTLAEKSKLLEKAEAELRQSREEQAKEQEEMARLRARVNEMQSKLQQYDALDASYNAYRDGEGSSSEESDAEDEEDEEDEAEDGSARRGASGAKKKKKKKSWFRGWFPGLRDSAAGSGEEEDDDDEDDDEGTERRGGDAEDALLSRSAPTRAYSA